MATTLPLVTCVQEKERSKKLHADQVSFHIFKESKGSARLELDIPISNLLFSPEPGGLRVWDYQTIQKVQGSNLSQIQ